MNFQSEEFYHVYNQGNNKQRIFMEDEDYKRFLYGVKSNIMPYSQVHAYCIMPNHFHFLLEANNKCCEKVKQGKLEVDPLTNGFRLLLSQYAQWFNKKYFTSGSVFRQKTKSKLLAGTHLENCVQYIQLNPVRAGLVPTAEEWRWSSCNHDTGLTRSV